jgi:hypothetical protein
MWRTTADLLTHSPKYRLTPSATATSFAPLQKILQTLLVAVQG